MKRFLFVALAASFLVFGCESTKSTAPTDESLNFDVIGDDSPASVAAAFEELAELDVVVPDPVTDENLRELSSLDSESDMVAIDRSTLEEGDRPNFRRIIHHLHQQFRGVRECVRNSDDPELHRLAYGAHLAMRRGVRALENEHPRVALQAFHRANRLLNLLQRICNGEDNGGTRP